MAEPCGASATPRASIPSDQATAMEKVLLFDVIQDWCEVELSSNENVPSPTLSEPQTGSHCDPIQSISVHAEKYVKEDPEASSSEKDEETNRFTEFVDDSIVKTEVFLKEESSSQCDITHQDVPSSSLLNTDAVVKLENYIKEEPESCTVSEGIVPCNVDVDSDITVVELGTNVKKELETNAVLEKVVLPSDAGADNCIQGMPQHAFPTTDSDVNTQKVNSGMARQIHNLTKLTGVPSAVPQQIFSRIQNLRQNGLNSKQGTLFLPLLIPNTFPVSVPAPVEDTLLLSPQNSLPLQTSLQLPVQYTFTSPTQIPTHNQKSLPPLLQNTLPVPVTNTSPVPVINTLPKPVTNTSPVPVINTSPLPVTNTLPVSNTNGLPVQNGLPLLVRNMLPVSVRYTFASSKQLETAMQVPPHSQKILPVQGQITSQVSAHKQQNNNSLQETVSPPVQKLITVSSPIQKDATVPPPEQNFITETSPLQKTELVKSSPAHRPLKVISRKQNYSPVSPPSQKTSPALSSLQRALPASSPLQKTSTASSLKQENTPMPSPVQKSTTVLKLPPTTIVTSRQPGETVVLPSPVQKPTATFSPPKTTIATSSLQRATTVSSKQRVSSGSHSYRRVVPMLLPFQKRVPISLSRQKLTQDPGKKRSVEDAIQVSSLRLRTRTVSLKVPKTVSGSVNTKSETVKVKKFFLPTKSKRPTEALSVIKTKSFSHSPKQSTKPQAVNIQKWTSVPFNVHEFVSGPRKVQRIVPEPVWLRLHKANRGKVQEAEEARLPVKKTKSVLTEVAESNPEPRKEEGVLKLSVENRKPVPKNKSISTLNKNTFPIPVPILINDPLPICVYTC
ncbi:hypothetical protein Pcinc_011063 [Petrolisthes cinctipes]|uniref:Uncharacterized protein n=1 Tax=Petrolisthes cinctipes TaxID=88211 RepID=A0AAE1KTU5_PETCI|nr:hypothetical protein Pcinc_011063 [Petrolisthes cinctipes]